MFDGQEDTASPLIVGCFIPWHNRAFLPQSICPHIRHEFVSGRLSDSLGGDANASIGEENIQAAVLLERLVDDALHVRFFASIDLPAMNIDTRIERVYLSLMSLQMVRVEVTHKDSFGSIVRVLMASGSADSKRRVGASDDDDFALNSSTIAC